MPAKKQCDVIAEFIEVHKGRYGYSKVVYTKASNKVCIVCPVHGDFWQIPKSHRRGHGCPKCKAENTGNIKRKSKDKFIRDANKIHLDRYNYDKIVYTNSEVKVCITCELHGDFWQAPGSHLSGAHRFG